MFNMYFDKLRTLLCLGAHADDIEIGCGGTVLRLLAEHPNVQVHWVVLSACDERADEATRSAEVFLGSAGTQNLVLHTFRDSFFPYEGAALKQFFDELSQAIVPDVVLTHRLEDRHQDHRLVAELTWNTFRDHLILEYDIPKYEGDLGAPNVFVPLGQTTCHQKVETIVETFVSQNTKPWFAKDTFWSLLRLRGLECNSPTHLAEGLYCRKMTL